MLHIGPNAIPCSGGGVKATGKRQARVSGKAQRPQRDSTGFNLTVAQQEFLEFVFANLSDYEISGLGERLRKHHGLRVVLVDPWSVRGSFRLGVAAKLSDDDAGRYLAELQRRKRSGESYLRPLPRKRRLWGRR
jgi:hypothetical protein